MGTRTRAHAPLGSCSHAGAALGTGRGGWLRGCWCWKWPNAYMRSTASEVTTSRMGVLAKSIGSALSGWGIGPCVSTCQVAEWGFLVPQLPRIVGAGQVHGLDTYS